MSNNRRLVISHVSKSCDTAYRFVTKFVESSEFLCKLRAYLASRVLALELSPRGITWSPLGESRNLIESRYRSFAPDAPFLLFFLSSLRPSRYSNPKQTPRHTSIVRWETFNSSTGYLDTRYYLHARRTFTGKFHSNAFHSSVQGKCND